jgi:acyl-CoA dehydrogenase
LLAAGSEDQRRTYLPSLLRADDVWCQLFSEPGAGSDVAGLSTRAVRDGNHFVVEGQKVWTSGAARCSHGLLLARTNPDAPKHRGLTMMVVSMRAEGVLVRPLRQMNGASRFNEVFFDSVRVPLDAVVGEIDGGWQAATAIMATERVSIGGGSAGRDSHDVAALTAAVRRRGSTTDSNVRQQLVRAVERELIADVLVQRVASSVIAGRTPGPEGSLLKLAATRRSQLAAELGTQIAGVDAIAWDPAERNRWADVALAAPGLSIGGGTTEVHKNVVGERVMGLPREPKPGGG